jgi:four helix bundle protein
MPNEKKYLKLADIEAYTIAFSLSNYVWEIVVTWEYFERRTVGQQFVEAVDSISANIAEGFGRFGKKDKIRFYRYADGSVFESLDWNEKSKIRELLLPEQYSHVFDELQKLPKAIKSLVKFTNTKLTI